MLLDSLGLIFRTHEEVSIEGVATGYGPTLCQQLIAQILFPVIKKKEPLSQGYSAQEALLLAAPARELTTQLFLTVQQFLQEKKQKQKLSSLFLLGEHTICLQKAHTYMDHLQAPN